ncbi:hypothetical protein GCM10009808_26160 [Microbacterium sediminicola]|uniref:FHA domain-containing protein n=1 Tax=Microbacterium sediminicola TaxID=415210 RepID=A0ABP4UPB5_9MICO
MLDGASSSTTFLLFVPGLVVTLALYVWCALALGAVFAKSGGGRWMAWVPFLNIARLLSIAGISGWWVSIVLVPVLGGIALWVLMIVAAHRVNVAFGYGGGMTVLAALLFPIWATVLGFGPATWIGRQEGPRRSSRNTLVFEDLFADAAYEPSVRSTVAASAPAEPATRSAAAPPPAPRPVTSPFAPPVVDEATAEPEPGVLGDAGPSPSGAGSAPTAPIQVFAPAPSVRPVQTGATGLEFASEITDEVTGAVTGAPAPVSARSGPSRLTDDPVVPPVREAVEADDDGSEPSSDIEQDADAPVRAPAASAAAAFAADLPDDVEMTVLASRNRPRWTLATRTGEKFELLSTMVILGRHPAPDPGRSDAMLITLEDPTVSKTHARLELRGEQWFVTDLGSTNGVVVVSSRGVETELKPGVETLATERLLLGDLDLRLTRDIR